MSVRTSKPYNAAQRTRAGQVMTATLDARDRETAQTWSGGAPNVSRSFDAAGRLLASSNGNTAASYSYNVANEGNGVRRHESVGETHFKSARSVGEHDLV